MRQTCIAGGLVTVVFLSSFLWSWGQPAPVARAAVEGKKDPPTLRTTGSATVRLKPDAARVFFGVLTQATTVKEARAENNRRMHKIMEVLAGLKIPDLKSKTSDVRVDLLHGRHDTNQLPPIIGYRVASTFTVLIQEEDTTKLGTLSAQVLDAALENGANSVEQVVFLSKSGMTEARQKALKQAVEDALANAHALAAGAKKTQIETFAIDGHPVYQDRYMGSRNQMTQVANVAFPAGGGNEAAMVVGDLEVTCQVQLQCGF